MDKVHNLLSSGHSLTQPIPHTRSVSSANVSFHHIPTFFTPLIGREHEVQEASSLLLLPQVRLLTLSGPGGIGKTRLALQIAEHVRSAFPDGYYFVPLTPINDPALVVSTIIETLGLRETTPATLFEDLQAFLSDRHCLFVFDNFEQVVTAAPTLVTLLAECPRVKIVVTSRIVLNVQGEYVFPVPPLALPDLEHLSDIEMLLNAASVALFVQRVQTIKHDFQLTVANANVIAGICTRLDGLPLAIELAAARTKRLSLEELLIQLGRRLHVLSSDDPDLQILYNTLTWSYNSLTADEQWLFRHLCVFVSDFTLEAVEAICTTLGGMKTISMLEGVTSLLDKGLLRHVKREEDEPRFYMLRVLREFGWEYLTASGEQERTQQAYTTYYRLLAEQAEIGLQGRDRKAWLVKLEQENGNMGAVLQWLLERNELEAVLHCAAALGEFWFLSRYISQGRSFLERALIASSENRVVISVQVKARALHAAGRLAMWQYDDELAAVFLEECVQLFRVLKNKQVLASALSSLSLVRNRQGNFTKADMLYEEAVKLSRESGEKRSIAQVLMAQAVMLFFRGAFARVRMLCEESLILSREVGDSWTTAVNLHYLGWTAYSQREYTTAYRFSEESVTLLKALGNPGFTIEALTVLADEMITLGDESTAASILGEVLTRARKGENKLDIAQVLRGLGRVALRQGNMKQARALFEESMMTALGMRSSSPKCKNLLASCLEEIGKIALAQGQAAWTVRLFSAAETLRTMNGSHSPIWKEQPFYEQALAEARTALGKETFVALWAEGLRLTPEQALAAEGHSVISQSVQVAPSPAQAATPLLSPVLLTKREVEVLRLLVEGLTNAQIAERLMIRIPTVNTHVESIYSKLGVSSRSAATRYAIERHLL